MSKFNFNLSEIDINELTIENIGSWPAPVKVIASLVLMLLVVYGSYTLMISDLTDEIDRAVAKESDLKGTYRVKYATAVNLDTYKAQMREMEDKFSLLLKKLPTTHETAGLLDDVSYVGQTSGLTFVKIQWLPEIEKEFYTELPIEIEVLGGYHEFGEFVSKVAALPRIVSLHDFTITTDKDEKLQFKVIAKTYRYKGQS